jgi:nucleoside phosphorylase
VRRNRRWARPKSRKVLSREVRRNSRKLLGHQVPPIAGNPEAITSNPKPNFMPNNRNNLAAIPLASAAAYKQLTQARHGNAPVYILSAESISGMPALPTVDWNSTGKAAPQPIAIGTFGKGQALPKADIIIITWTSAEWAALDHVFCDSDQPMSYNASAETKSFATDWQLYDRDFSSVVDQLTSRSPSKDAGGWGKFRMVTVNSKRVLLFKSDMHLSTDGTPIPALQMVDQIIADSTPSLILTIGTAGGTRNQDNLGSVNITNGAHFLLEASFKSKPFNNQTFADNWTFTAADLSLVNKLLLPTPVTTTVLQELLDKMNTQEKTSLTLADVMNAEIKPGAIPPVLNTLSPAPTLTTNGYGVADDNGNYASYAVMEMDDAVVAMEAKAKNIPFGIVRNISDPVQVSSLKSSIQESWAGTIYNTYGFYSSYNGALAAWAILQS